MFAFDRCQRSCGQDDEEEEGADAEDEVTHVLVLELSSFFLLVESFIKLRLLLVLPSRYLEFIFDSTMYHSVLLDDVGLFAIQLGHFGGAVQQRAQVLLLHHLGLACGVQCDEAQLFNSSF